MALDTDAVRALAIGIAFNFCAISSYIEDSPYVVADHIRDYIETGKHPMR